jgi:hypothetical protein
VTQRAAQTFGAMHSRLRKLEARTAGIDSGFPLMMLPAVIDSGYSGSGDPMAYVNGAASLSGPFACLSSYAPLAGDAVLMMPLPAARTYVILGLSGPRPFQQVSSLANSWGFHSGGFLKYRLTGDNSLQLVGCNLNPGTATDGTAIIASGGLPAAYRPAGTRYVPAWCDRLAAYSGISEAAGLAVLSTGEIDCYGVSASASRLDFSVTLPLSA